VIEKDLIVYKMKDGKEPFQEWRKSLRDKVTLTRIDRRLEYVARGNYGDYKNVGEGVYELRFFFGSGYRVYFAEDGDTVVLLLCGGDKSTQSKDIVKAKSYWKDYQADKKTKAKDEIQQQPQKKESKKEDKQ
jgi:putative addiction module killer protein